jgi:WD40 repeat protein
MAFTPDGKVLVGAGNYGVKDPVSGRIRPRGQISIWDMNTGRLLRTMTGHTSGIRCVAITDDGKMIASGSSGPVKPYRGGTKVVTELRMWDLQTGRLLSTFAGGLDDGYDILSLDFVPNAKTLAVADDKAVFLFDPQAPQQKRVLLETVLRLFSSK